MTMMFFQLWEITGEQSVAQYDKYRPSAFEKLDTEDDSFVLPFSDSPLDDENVGELVYMNIINNAKDYVYIFTPYLLPDSELESSIKAAAQRGVDVRIFVPGIPDKVSVSLLTKSHYRPLINSGVRIFEYSKGFVHSKVFVSDDIKAIVGTINLDNRSLVYHFECGAYIYNSSVIDDIKKDFTSSPDDYTEITAENIDSYSEAGGYLLKSIEGLL